MSAWFKKYQFFTFKFTFYVFIRQGKTEHKSIISRSYISVYFKNYQNIKVVGFNMINYRKSIIFIEWDIMFKEEIKLIDKKKIIFINYGLHQVPNLPGFSLTFLFYLYSIL